MPDEGVGGGGEGPGGGGAGLEPAQNAVMSDEEQPALDRSIRCCAAQDVHLT